jgi:DNA-binding NarL/FixJ family response regulator
VGAVGKPTRVLIVEDEPLASRAMASAVRRIGGEPIVATSAWAARHALAGAPDWGAFVIDVGLPDGSGMDVLRYARKGNPTTPAMILTGVLQPELANEAYDLRSICLWKPYEFERFARFFRDASVYDRGTTDPIDDVVQDWALRYGLSTADADVLRKTAAGETCEWIAGSRATAASTVKSQWKRIREKTGEPTIGSVVNRLLHEAVLSARCRT